MDPELLINNAFVLLSKGFSEEEVVQNLGLDPRQVSNVARLMERGLSLDEVIRSEMSGLEGRDRAGSQGAGMDEQIMGQLLQSLVQPQQQAPENPIAQFLKILQFASTPMENVGANELSPEQRASLGSTVPVFNERGQSGLGALAQLFSAGQRPSGTALQDQPQDATAVAHETFVNRLIEDSLIRDMIKREPETGRLGPKARR